MKFKLTNNSEIVLSELENRKSLTIIQEVKILLNPHFLIANTLGSELDLPIELNAVMSIELPETGGDVTDGLYLKDFVDRAKAALGDNVMSHDLDLVESVAVIAAVINGEFSEPFEIKARLSVGDIVRGIIEREEPDYRAFKRSDGSAEECDCDDCRFSRNLNFHEEIERFLDRYDD